MRSIKCRIYVLNASTDNPLIPSIILTSVKHFLVSCNYSNHEIDENCTLFEYALIGCEWREIRFDSNHVIYLKQFLLGIKIIYNYAKINKL